ncbi:MAG: carboxymuconolactone decarboxylase family protein [Bacteroidetes bacterium]|nr:MAG: carboxymuconolactone decarboxylase family protein [Bacteroidota bacterium]
MKKLIKKIVKGIILFISLFLITVNVSAQETDAYEKAKTEIELTFGTVPSWFASYPEHALPEAWELFKTLKGPKSSISSKNSELIQLAVASQIPCVYCVYFHRIFAKAFGATDEEINEAIALGAETRHWSMVIQGSGISFEDFKVEFDQAMKYMSEKTKN